MGEVRTKIRLTSFFDEGMARRNMIKPQEMRTYEADALVDTGAVRSVVPDFVVERLGLAVRSRKVVEHKDGRKETVGMTEPVVFDIDGRDTLEEALVLGDEVIIGQTVLEKMDLVVDCANRRLYPNPAHPDQPVSRMK